jgi:hypothetical protein
MAISVPGGDYEVPLDIANAACDYLGTSQITSFQQNNKVANRLSFRYDKVRKYELERNLWVFSIRKAVISPVDTTTMSVTFGTWNAAATYVLGSVALDPATGKLYQATTAISANVPPSANPGLWEEYFGPDVCDVWTLGAPGGPQPWSSATSYQAGSDVVGSDGSVYLSLINGNANINPVTDGGVHWQKVGPAPTGNGYYAGQIVYYPATAGTAQVYLSLVSNNVQTPGTLSGWISTQTYYKGDVVSGPGIGITYLGTPVFYLGTSCLFGGVGAYQSTEDLNVGNIPGSSSAWEPVPATQADQVAGTGWLLLGKASLSALRIIYPLGAGPASDTFSLNIYKLPYGYLREAPQDPKGGQLTWLGGPSNKIMLDWNYENGYLTTATFTPINFRFGADVTDVSRFDPMFCELFASRLALEAAELVTQAAGKKASIAQEYARWGAEARTRNGIEIGPIQAEEDEYISVRR